MFIVVVTNYITVNSRSDKSNLSLKTLQYSAAEVLAAAVMELFPQVLLVKGDVFEWGFLYDFVFSHPFTEQHLTIVEERMREIIKKRPKLTPVEMLRDNARSYFLDNNQKIKAEILEAVNDNLVELLRIGEFFDVCPSPYITDTKQIEAFRLRKCSDKIIPLPSREIRVTRLIGSVYHDKASLKKSFETY